jgi:hypothetical protein
VTITSSAVLNLYGSGSFGSGAAPTLTNATAQLVGTLDLGGTTQTWTGSSGVFLIDGGTLKSGTLAAAGVTFEGTGSSGTLDGITLDVPLDLATYNNSQLGVIDGLTINSTLTLGQADGSTAGQMYFLNTQTLDGTGTILFGGSGNNLLDMAVSNGQLTIGPNLLIHGQSGSLVIGGNNSVIVNQGTIAADVAEGQVQLRGNGTWSNTGTWEATNGDFLNVYPISWSNSGTLAATGVHSRLDLVGTWSSTGTVTITSAALNMYGSGSFGNGAAPTLINATAQLMGTLDLGAMVQTWNGSSGVFLIDGGTLKSGTLMAAGVSFEGTSSGGTLDGMTLDTPLDLATNNGANLSVVDGLTINNTVTLGLVPMTINGLLTWTGGTIQGGTVNANDGMNIGGSSQKTLDGCTLNNAGTATWSATGDVNVFNGTVINNLVGATFDAQNNQSFLSNYTPWTSSNLGTFNNAGTFLKSAGTGQSTIAASFNNSGTVTVENGVLSLQGGDSLGSTGSFVVEAGSTLDFGGSISFHLQAPSTVSGPGNVIVSDVYRDVFISGIYNITGQTTVGAGSADFYGNVVSVGNSLSITSSSEPVAAVANFYSNTITVPSLSLFGNAYLGGSATITVIDPISWTAGLMNGSGTTYAAGGFVYSNSSIFAGGLDSGRTLINAGTASRGYGQQPFLVRGGAIINNMGVWTLDVSGGTFIQSSGATTVSGSFDANSVTILGGALNGSGTIAGNVTNSGTISPGSNGSPGTLTVNGAMTNMGTVIISSGSTLAVNGSNLPTNGLVSWWTGDGNANDSAGGNNGTIHGGTTFVPGHIGQAFTFNGTDAYVSLPLPETGKGRDIPTLALWIKTTNPSQAIIDGGLPYYTWRIGLNSAGQVVYQHFRNNLGGYITLTGTTDVADGQFHFLAAETDQAGKAISLYVDGTLQASYVEMDPAFSTWASSTDIKLGKSDTQGLPGPLFYNGIAAGVAIYDRPLSAQEILASFDAHPYQQASGTTALQGGNIVSPGGTNIEGGTLSGTGTISGGLFNSGQIGGTAAPANGLVSSWLNDSSPNDSVGANNGTLTGTSLVPGELGNGRRFMPGDLFSADGSGTLNLTGNQVSIDAWIKLENNPTTDQAFTAEVGKTNFPNNQSYLITFESGSAIGLPQNKWRFEYILTNSDGTRVHDQSTGVDVQVDGQYHHYAMTYDGANVRLYIDGALQGTFAFSGNLESVPPEPFKILGATPFAIEGVNVYNRALTQAEIQATFNGRGATVGAPGILTVSGNYTQSSNGTLDEEVGGTSPGNGYDQLNVSGTATLAGNLNVSLINGFIPSAASQYQILTFASLNGDFDSKNGLVPYFVPVYNPTNLKLTGIGVLSITSGTLPNWTVNQPYSQTISTSGGLAPLTFSVSAGSLPTGLNLDSTSGVISGTPSATGAYSFTVTVTDVTDGASTQSYVVTINPALTICIPAPAGLVSWWPADGNGNDIVRGNNGALQGGAGFATGEVGQGFSFDGVDDLVNVPASSSLNIQSALTLEAWVNPSSYVTALGFEVIAGRPFGYQLTLMPNGRVRFAFPSGGGGAVNDYVDSLNPLPLNAFTHVAGTYDSTTGQAEIYLNGALEATAQYSGVIDGMTKPFQIGGFSDPNFTGGFIQGVVDEIGFFDRVLSANEIKSIYNAGSAGMCMILPNWTINQPYRQTFATSGGTTPFTFSVTSGGLPDGLNLNSTSGLISGMPTATGSFSFTISLIDAAGATVSQSSALTINAAPSITTTSLPDTTIGQPYTQTVVTSGGTAPLTFSVSAGSLPAGLNLDSIGNLTGTPTTAGTYSFTIQATDISGASASQPYNVTIYPVPAATLSIDPASDSGAPNHPGFTNVTNPTFDVQVNQAGTISLDFESNGQFVASQSVSGTGTYQLTVPSSLPDGTYTATAIFTAATGLTAQGSATYTIDTVPPTVTSISPTGTVNTSVDQATITFSEPVDLNSLSLAITLTGPTGSVTLNPPHLVSGSTYKIGFLSQTAEASYTLTIASNVSDFAGNPMGQTFTGTFTIALPELAATAPSAASSAVEGTSLPLSWTVTNESTTNPAPGPWNDSVYLSANSVLDSTATKLISVAAPAQSPLGPGASYTRSSSVTIPGNFAAGDYFLLFVANDNGGQAESDSGKDTNDIVANPISLSAPDFQVSGISGPANGFNGQSVQVSWTDVNIGNAAATGHWMDNVYAATDAQGDNPILLGSFTFSGSLAVGASEQPILSVTLPSAGTYWFVVTTNVNRDVQESSFDNNTTVSAASIKVASVPLPDLVVTSITPPPNGVFSGNFVPVSFIITNQGNGPTSVPVWTDWVILSQDPTLGQNYNGSNDQILVNQSILLGFKNPSYLDAGQSYMQSVNMHLPISAQGTWYVYVIPDGLGLHIHPSMPEGSRSDKLAISAGFNVTLSPPPDLAVTSVKAPAQNFSGQPMNLTWTVANQGTGPTDADTWTDFVYMSLNPTLDSSATLLGGFTHQGALAPGSSYTGSGTVTLPIGVSGSFYFLVDTDSKGQVFENGATANNVGATATTETVNLTPPPDLEVTSVTAPATALAGHGITFSYSVSNAGANGTPNDTWNDSFYLSPTSAFDSSTAIFLGQEAHQGTLDAGAGYDVHNVTETLPNGLSGMYYLLVDTDSGNAVFELDKSNNIAASPGTIQIKSAPADLVVSAANAPATALAGSAVLVNWTVTNLGSGDTVVTSWQDNVYADAGATVNDQSNLLGSFTHTGLLNPGDSYMQSQLVALPIKLLGAYNLFVVTNPLHTVYESDTNNNASPALPITISLQIPGSGGGGGQQTEVSDLQITSVTAQFAAETRSSVTVNWTVKNNGPGTTNSNYWYDDVWLSTHTTLKSGGTDIYLGTVQHTNQLAAGASYSTASTFTLPANSPAGDYYFIVATDRPVAPPNDTNNQGVDLVFETNEMNNETAAGTATAVSVAPAADLTVSNVTAPSTAISGGLLSVSWTVTNIGANTGKVPITDSVYLSYDQTFDTTGRALASFKYEGGLVSRASYTRNVTVSLPPGFAGTYYVYVVTNANNNVYELNTSNDLAYDIQPLQIILATPVDLVAGSVLIPANAVAGQNIAITYQVTNNGGVPANGSWFDSLYLSPTTTWNVSDPLVGTVSQTQNLAPGGSYTGTLTAPLPGVAPGSYYVILRTNILNSYPEVTQSNNLSASLTQTAIDAPALTLGTPATGTLNQGQAAFYKVVVDANQTLQVSFTSQTTTAANELYLSFGTMPTRAKYDYRYSQPLQADQQITIPATQAGSYYILAYGYSVPAVPQEGGGNSGPVESYTLRASLVPFSIQAVTPGQVGNTGASTLQIDGAKFDRSTTFQLIDPSGNVIQDSAVFLQDASTAFATFDLTGKPVGTYSLQATQSDGTTTQLIAALTVVTGTGPQLQTGLAMPSFVLVNREDTFSVSYANNGDADEIAPMLSIFSSTNTPMGLTPTDVINGQNLQFFAISQNGPAGILRPGAHFSVPVYFNNEGKPYHFQVFILDSRNTDPVDWSMVQTMINSTRITDPNWSAVYTQLQNQLGTTWGSFVTALAHDATLLPPELGDHSNPVDLLDLEVQKAQATVDTSISGRVNAADLAVPIAGHYILANNTTTGRVFSARVLNDGSFYFAPVPGGTYSFAFDAAIVTSANQVSLASGQAARNLAINLSPSGTFVGTVMAEETGQPLPSASIRAIAADGTVYTVFSDANGRYELQQLEPSTYTVVADAARLARTFASGILLGAGDQLTIPITMKFESIITGAISLPTGGPTGGPLQIQAEAIGNTNSNLVFDATSQTTNFAVKELPSGTYDVTISLHGYVSQTIANVLVGEGGVADLGTISLVATATISGTVTLTDSQTPAGFAQVGAYKGTTLVASTQADGTGNFVLTNLDPGMYTVSPLVGDSSFPVSATATVASGDNLTGVLIGIEPGGSITGTVTDTTSGDLLAQVAVTAIDPNGNLLSTTTDENGNFSFKHLSLGSYVVNLIINGITNSQTVAITSLDGQQVQTNFQASFQASLTGNVMDSVGTGFPKAVVNLYQEGQLIASTQADTNGKYTFLFIQPGDYDLQASFPGASFAAVTGITINAGTAVQQNLVAGTATLQVTLTDTNASVSGASVLLEQNTSNGPLEVAIATVGADGVATFSNLAAGGYLVKAYDGAHNSAYSSITVTDASSSQLIVNLATLGELNGTITDSQSTPIAEANIVLYSPNTSKAQFSTVSAGVGTYLISDVPNGTYDLVVYADGHKEMLKSGIIISNAMTINVILPTTSSKLDGALVDASGNPIANGSVTVLDFLGHVIGRAISQADGSFNITSASGSALTLQASKTGYANEEIAGINLPSGLTTHAGVIRLGAPSAVSATTDPVLSSVPVLEAALASEVVYNNGLQAGYTFTATDSIGLTVGLKAINVIPGSNDFLAVIFQDPFGNLVLAFRGTIPPASSLSGFAVTLKTDFDFYKDQWNQFNQNLITYPIEHYLASAPSGRILTVTGHSLGGALAQLFAYNAPDSDRNRIGQLITFNSPGVLFALGGWYLQSRLSGITIEHFATAGDIVSKLGGGDIGYNGSQFPYVIGTWQDWLSAHDMDHVLSLALQDQMSPYALEFVPQYTPSDYFSHMLEQVFVTYISNTLSSIDQALFGSPPSLRVEIESLVIDVSLGVALGLVDPNIQPLLGQIVAGTLLHYHIIDQTSYNLLVAPDWPQVVVVLVKFVDLVQQSQLLKDTVSLSTMDNEIEQIRGLVATLPITIQQLNSMIDIAVGNIQNAIDNFCTVPGADPQAVFNTELNNLNQFVTDFVTNNIDTLESQAQDPLRTDLSDLGNEVQSYFSSKIDDALTPLQDQIDMLSCNNNNSNNNNNNGGGGGAGGGGTGGGGTGGGGGAGGGGGGGGSGSGGGGGSQGTPTISLMIGAGTVAESAGPFATNAIVTRINDPFMSQSLAVSLTSSDSGDLVVPTQVVIPAGQTSVVFRIGTIDDDLFSGTDGTQTVTVTADAFGFLPGTATVNVTDDTPTLGLAISPSTFSEKAGAYASNGKVTRNNATDLSHALVVGLASSNTRQATVPGTVTIPAGKISATFSITAVDDFIVTPPNVVTITASAIGYASAGGVVVVTEADSPPPGTPDGSGGGTPVAPKDPNDILGPAGFGDNHFVPAGHPLPYKILFENQPTATAPAQQVVITQQLDPNLDWRTFRLGSFGFGGQIFQVPVNAAYYQTRIDLTQTSGFYVDVTATIDEINGMATWTFTTIDPNTGQIPINGSIGFLPPDDANGIGEGFVSYTILPKQSDPTGAVINAQATVVFDTQPSLDTPQIFNTIDAGTGLSSSVAPLPPFEPNTQFNVSWSGTDAANGSAISSFTIYVSDNDGPYTAWLANTTLTSAPFVGQLGHTYAFYSLGTDNAGNVEPAHAVPDAVTLVPFPIQLTAGPDQSVNEGDLVSLPGAMYTFSGHPQTLKLSADWGDGTVEPGILIPSTGGGTIGNTHRYADDGNYVVTLTLSDSSGDSAVDSLKVAVSNVPPTGTFGNNGPVNEGLLVTISFTNQLDPSSVDTAAGFKYSYDFNNDGVFDVVDSSNSSASFIFAEEGSYVVTGRIEDEDGSFTLYQTTVTVNDASLSPSAVTLTPTEGATFTGVVASFTDADPNGTASDYNATIDWGDGHISAAVISANSKGGFDVSGTNTYLEEGSYQVTVAIRDAGGSMATANNKANVAEAALRATGQNVTGQEGILLTATLASFIDADPNGTVGDYAASINWGDGSSASAGTIGVSGSTFIVSGSHAYPEEGNYTVSVTITDIGGSRVVATSTATVAIVPPTASLRGSSDGVPGQPRTFALGATDPSPVDQAAGFTYVINWGDGSPTLTVPRVPGNGSGVKLDHIFTKPGSYTVKETATEDGGTSGSASTTVIIKSVEMQGNSLAVAGTLGNDTIILSPADSVGDINVTLNGVSQGNFLPTDHILVYGQSGNDSIQLASQKIKGTTYYMTVPAFLYGGGTGHDVLDARGSSANNVLIGGGGTNTLYGGLGRDLLIAGLGASALHAGTGDDILIGGSTDYDLTSTLMTYDQKLVALEAITAEWGRKDADYLTRVHHLDGSLSGGLNGSFLLNATTVHSNGQADTLFGASSPALDWFFADIADLIKGNRNGELVTLIS